MTLNDPADPSPRSAGAIYQAGRDMRLFEDRTARRVGDTVVIRLVENTAATKSAKTGVEKSSDINLANPIIFGASFGNPALAAAKNNYATTVSYTHLDVYKRQGQHDHRPAQFPGERPDHHH